MKIQIKSIVPAIVGILLGASLISIMHPAQGQQHNARSMPAVAVFEVRAKYQNGENTGYYVHLPQTSPSCPKLEEGVPLADAMEYLMHFGLKIQDQFGYGYIMVRD